MAQIAQNIKDNNISKIDNRKNLFELLKGHVKGKYNTNNMSFENPTMMQLAAAYNKYEVVKYLLQYGCDPNVPRISFQFSHDILIPIFYSDIFFSFI